MASLKDLKVELVDVNRSIEEIQKKVQTLLEKQEKFHVRKRQLEDEISKREMNERTSADRGETLWSSKNFPWSSKLESVLLDTFAIKELRMLQLETINATMSKRDVILIMPTGGGKSLCYQAPAILSEGVTLVVSPLISLIEDQIISLQNLGICAAKLSASSTREEVKATHNDMVSKNPKLKLLYVTPEKISKSKRFMAQLEKCYKAGNLIRIAIDEVHCASQWGNDFRPDYKILGILKRQFPETPLLGLTATATDKVTVDTKKILNAPFALVFRAQLNRPNLYYQVRRKPDTLDAAISEVAEIINSTFRNKSGIIYCFSCKDCESVCSSICALGIQAAAYHAQLTPEQRSRVHKLWLENKVQVICATVAFGMGINKSDVRYVIHFSLSKSVENYYQESGRAGRDGLPALCLLYYGFADIFRQSTMVLTEQTGLENLNKILEYCQNISICRRMVIFSHFGEDFNPELCSDSCDVCCTVQAHCTQDVTELCNSLVQILHRASDSNDRLTGLKLISAANGRGKFKTSNRLLKDMTDENLQRLIVFMLRNQYIKEDFHFTPYSTISYLEPGPRVSVLAIQPATLSLLEPPSDQSQVMQMYNTFSKKLHIDNGTATLKKRPSCEAPSGSYSKKIKTQPDEPDKIKESEDKLADGKPSMRKEVVEKKTALSSSIVKPVAIVISDSDDDFT